MTRFTLLLASAAAMAWSASGDAAPARSPDAARKQVSGRTRDLPSVPELAIPGRLPARTSSQPWWDGVVYRLETAPERVSDIALQAGEALIAVAAGDTARWVIGDTTSGLGANRRTHILVKPAASGLRTNLVITTDRRVYHLDLRSGGRAMTGISWIYPQDELLALRQKEAELAEAQPVAGRIAIERLNFNYEIRGDAPAWRPVRAFDDGAQVFIEFPAGLEGAEAPPLFVVGASGGAELVNYRKRGRYYVVDRLFEAAELRLGEKRQQVVRIARGAGSRQRGRGKSS